MLKKLHLIAACTRRYGIAYEGKIPWRVPEELRHFKKITTESVQGLQNAVIMGRKTFSSIGAFLPERKNYIITRNEALLRGANFYPSLEAAVYTASADNSIDKIFIIGGGEIYTEVLTKFPHALSSSYISIIDTDTYTCDTYFPIDLFMNLHVSQSNKPFEIVPKVTCHSFLPKNAGENEYINLVQRVLTNGERRADRTGTGTLSLFAEKMTFDISMCIPILTTKRIPWQTVVKELLWFLSGSTDATVLSNTGVHIWDDNTTREFLDTRGLQALPVGDIGAGYGHQWRHFGAEYGTCKSDYTGKGIDQIAEVIRLIRTDPTSRRILLTGWNPAALHMMALPPCHSITVQFYVRGAEWLDCQMYQRSGDIGLGVPFNIASYSILVYMIAQVTGLKPGRFVHILGDAHIYLNHVKALQEQITRVPYGFPFLQLDKSVKSIDHFKLEHFKVYEYEYYPAIRMPFAV